MSTQTQDMRADGQVKVVFVPSIADVTAPTVTELTAAGVVDLSCFIKSDGRSHTIDEATIDNGKLCDTTDPQMPGRVTHNWAVTYARKQATADDTAYATLKHLTNGFLVERFGKPYSTAFAAADVVNIYEIACGEQNEKADKNDIVWIDSQKLFVTEDPQRDVAVAA